MQALPKEILILLKVLILRNSQALLSMYQTTPQNTSNPLTTQPNPPKATFHIPILTGPHVSYTTYLERDHSEEKQKEWRVKQDISKHNMNEEIMNVIKKTLLHF